MNLADTIKLMRAAGCTDTQILDAIEDQERLAAEQRRERDAERKRAKRAADKAASDVSAASETSAGHRGQIEPPIENAPAHVEGNPFRVTPTRKKIDSPHSPPRGAKRGTRIPDDWQPDMAAARREGLPDAEAEREAERFRDYYLGAPNAKGVKLDWAATWRNWCRNAVDRRKVSGRGQGPPRPPSMSELCDKPFSETFR